MTLRPSADFTIEQLNVHYSQCTQCAGYVPDATQEGRVMRQIDVIAAVLVSSSRSTGGSLPSAGSTSSPRCSGCDSVILPKDE